MPLRGPLGSLGTEPVNGALRQLVKSDFLKVEPRPGEPNTVFLLEETGAGVEYSIPGRRWTELKATGNDSSPHRYFKVPGALWTNGWIAALNGPAVAMLLVLLSLASGQDHNDLWFSPGVADERFRLSEETRKKGIDWLRDAGLVTVGRRPITGDTFAVPRLRNTYTLNLDALCAPTQPSRR